MIILDFDSAVESGVFTDCDGFGCAVVNNGEYKIDGMDDILYPSDYLNLIGPNVTHILWYNR